MSDKNLIMLNNENFKTEVIDEDIPVVVDFYADWCGPCKMIGPIIDELAEKFSSDEVKFCKVNVEQQRELAIKFKVMSIPTILFYKDGEQVNRITGAVSKNELSSLINEML